MSNYRLDIKLQQYTPLLHFQGDTEGACLRASEVKPKLDRFVVNYLGEKNIPDHWKLSIPSDGKGAVHGFTLNYKMRFHAESEKIILKNYRQGKKEIHPLYFAAMGKSDSGVWDENGASKIKGVFYPNGISMTILAVKAADLLAQLAKLLPAFFLLHCFGNRSNKGFGSFQVSTINDDPQNCFMSPQKLANYLPSKTPALYYIQYPIRGYLREPLDTQNYGRQYLDDIQSLSALMKGGINYTHGRTSDPSYFKGAIFQYMMQGHDQLHSEKALVKRDVLKCQIEDTEVQKLFKKADIALPDSEFLYMRAVLGLAQGFTYRKDERKQNGQVIPVNSHSYRSGEVSVTGKETDEKGQPLIGRFENPIHFKPHGCYILILPQQIPNKLLGAEFILEGRKNRKLTGRAVVNVPYNFNLDDFLSYFSELYRNDAKINEYRKMKVDPYKSKPLDKIIATVQRINTIYRVEKPKEGGN